MRRIHFDNTASVLLCLAFLSMFDDWKRKKKGKDAISASKA
jgi:hypothetical protein